MYQWSDVSLPPINLWNFPRKEKGMMSIVLTDSNGTYTVKLDREFVTLEEYIELLVKPVLLAAGFHPDSINRYIDND